MYKINGYDINSKECLKDIDIREKLGSGEGGSVYLACIKGLCSYVVKVTETTSDLFNSFEDEVALTRNMSDLGVSPKFIESWTCPANINDESHELGFLVTERWDSTLDKYQHKLSAHLIHKLDRLVKTMHENGYTHGDLSPYNVIIKVNHAGIAYDIAIIDFGTTFQGDELPEELDWLIGHNNVIREKYAPEYPKLESFEDLRDFEHNLTSFSDYI